VIIFSFGNESRADGAHKVNHKSGTRWKHFPFFCSSVYSVSCKK